MPIPATSVTVAQATPQPSGPVNLANWAIQTFIATGTGNPGNPSKGNIVLRKWGTDANGIDFESPQQPTEFGMYIPDYYALAAAEPLTGLALELLTLAVCVHAASVPGSGVGTGPTGTIQAAATAIANQLLAVVPSLRNGSGAAL